MMPVFYIHHPFTKCSQNVHQTPNEHLVNAQ